MGIKLDLDPEEEATLRMRARRNVEQKTSTTSYARHPWNFLRDAVWTLDQASSEKRKYPGHDMEPSPTCPCGGCVSYQHHLVNIWHNSRILAIPKSRRMLLTWTLVACHYWLARFHPGSSIFIVSRKQGQKDSEGSAELVRRAKFIHDNLPLSIPHVEKSYSHANLTLHLDPPSEIIGIGQGEDQLRQLTATAILFDEAAFMDEGRAAWISSLPVIEGGGKFTAVSSANPGWFAQLVHDTLDT